jgi:hypothetical protein
VELTGRIGIEGQKWGGKGVERTGKEGGDQKGGRTKKRLIGKNISKDI